MSMHMLKYCASKQSSRCSLYLFWINIDKSDVGYLAFGYLASAASCEYNVTLDKFIIDSPNEAKGKTNDFRKEREREIV